MEVKYTYVKMMLVLTVVLLILGGILFFQQQSYLPKLAIEEGFQTETNCPLARSVYLQRYPDVQNTGMDPWDHYRLQGKKRGFKWPGCSLTTPTLSFCPSFAPQIQTAKGSTDCCQGEKIDGKCNGSTFCTLSPEHDGIPTCINAWRDYFQKKADGNCPFTLPFYNEDVKKVGGPKFCSAGPTNVNGLAPKNPNDKRCTIYAAESQNRSLANSCYVERMRTQVKCPVFKGNRGVTSIQSSNNKFHYYYCQYNIPGALPQRCYEDKSVSNFLGEYNPNWRTGSGAQTTMDDFCSNFIASERRREAERKRVAEERKKREAAERIAREQREVAAKAEREKQAAIRARKDAEEQLRRARQECSARISQATSQVRRTR